MLRGQVKDPGMMEKSVKARMDNLSPEERPKGCEYCPLNEVLGIRKIKGTVEGKDIFVWADYEGGAFGCAPILHAAHVAQ
jgi:hypothetical protein